MNLYPLFMAPFFRSGEETPWGGNMLRDAFMKDSPEQTGESLDHPVTRVVATGIIRLLQIIQVEEV